MVTAAAALYTDQVRGVFVRGRLIRMVFAQGVFGQGSVDQRGHDPMVVKRGVYRMGAGRGVLPTRDELV